MALQPFTPLGAGGAVDASASHAFAITPSDTVDLPTPTRWIWVGTTGNIAVVLVGDADPGGAVTFNSVPVGRFMVCAKRVMATGTTASNLVGVT